MACVLYNLTDPFALPFNGPLPFPSRFLSNKVFSSSLSSSDSENVRLCAKYFPVNEKRSCYGKLTRKLNRSNLYILLYGGSE